MANTYYKPITIDDASLTVALTGFPLVVVLDGDADVGAHARSDGHDIRFKTVGGTNLPYQRRSFSVTGGEASGVFIVKVDAEDELTIRMWYGDSSLSTDVSSTDAWDTAFEGVYGFGDGALSLLDATDNDRDGSDPNDDFDAATGVLGGGLRNTGTTAYDGMSAGGFPVFVDTFTVEWWVKLDTPQVASSMFAAFDSNSSPLLHFTYTPGAGTLDLWDPVNDPWYPSCTLSGAFAHIAVVYNNGMQDVFVDGASIVTPRSVSAITEDVGPASIMVGGYPAYMYCHGIIDEVRVSSAARSADWIGFTSRSIDGSVLTFGAEASTIMTASAGIAEASASALGVASAKVAAVDIGSVRSTALAPSYSGVWPPDNGDGSEALSRNAFLLLLR